MWPMSYLLRSSGLSPTKPDPGLRAHTPNAQLRESGKASRGRHAPYGVLYCPEAPVQFQSLRWYPRRRSRGRMAHARDAHVVVGFKHPALTSHPTDRSPPELPSIAIFRPSRRTVSSRSARWLAGGRSSATRSPSLSSTRSTKRGKTVLRV